MNINALNTKHIATVGDLDSGTCFFHDNEYLILTDEMGLGFVMAVELASGVLYKIDDTTKVIPIEAEVVMK